MRDVRGAIEAAAGGTGGFVALRGEPGIGKTRLILEAVSLATSKGFATGRGAAIVESVALYHPWAEALRPLGLEHLLREEVQPRLVGVYLLSGSGLLAAKAEREGVRVQADLFAAMSSAVAAFLHDAITRAAGEVEGDLMRFAHGRRGVCVLRADGFALAALVEGRESEQLLADLRTAAEEIEAAAGDRVRRWRGDQEDHSAAERALRSLLDPGRYDGSQAQHDSQSRRLGLFENALRGIARKSESSPLLIALDDLQWADPSSLALLHHLARNIRAHRVLILGSYRVAGGDEDAELVNALGKMRREELLKEIDVTRLTPEECRALAEQELGRHSLPDAFFGVLARETEGNPLFVREVLRSLEGEGAIARDVSAGATLAHPLQHLQVPPRVRDVVARRLARLGREERALLDAASVFGTSFRGAHLARVAGEPEARVLRELTAIGRAHGIVRHDGREWRFDHSLLREVVYEELPPDLRELYHRSAADAIEALASNAIEFVAPALAHHYASGREPERALRFARLAAEAAERDLAPEQAAERYRFAVSVARGMTESPSWRQSLVALLMAAGRLDFDTGRWELAVESLEEAVRLAAPPDVPPATAAEARLGLGRVLARFNEFDRAEAMYRAALDLARESPGEGGGLLEARAMHGLGYVEWRRARYPESISLLEKALAAAERAGDRTLSALACIDLGNVRADRGEPERAAELQRRAIELMPPGNHLELSRAWNNLGDAMMKAKRWDDALAAFRECYEIGRRLSLRASVGWGAFNTAEVYLLTSRHREAMEWLSRAEEAMATVGDRIATLGIQRNYGQLYAFQGQWALAERHFDEAVRIARAIGVPHSVGEALAVYAGALLEQPGAPAKERAREMLDEAAEIFARLGISSWTSRVEELRAAAGQG